MIPDEGLILGTEYNIEFLTLMLNLNLLLVVVRARFSHNTVPYKASRVYTSYGRKVCIDRRTPTGSLFGIVDNKALKF